MSEVRKGTNPPPLGNKPPAPPNPPRAPFAEGDRVLLRSRHGRPTIEVTVLRGPMFRDECPHPGGMAYEVLFPPEHGGDVAAVAAAQLEPMP